jgi:LCP family protein required for cell wall assembly
MLADFLMLGVYNSNSGAVDFISIPRDTMVVVPQERYDTFRWKPRSTTVKINGIFNYAGSRDNGILLTVAQVEDLFNVSIDYYVTVELDGFRKLIDDVGGIEFDVPQRMYYTDPCQDLYIDLHPGLQRLSGIQAEGLVRYRRADIWNPQSPGYAMGDLRRVQVQQDFIAAAMKQILSSGRGFTALANMAMSNVRTNFPAVDIPRYAPEMLKIDTSAINTQTLPGTATNYSPWFYLPDVDGITKLVNEIYFANNQ